MTPAHKRYVSDPSDPKPASGYPVVIGPRAALDVYGRLAWIDVYAAALAGRDGLRVDTYGNASATPAADEFMLRETLKPSSLAGQPSLMRQNW
jgi:hypothetical protein